MGDDTMIYFGEDNDGTFLGRYNYVTQSIINK